MKKVRLEQVIDVLNDFKLHKEFDRDGEYTIREYNNVLLDAIADEIARLPVEE